MPSHARTLPDVAHAHAGNEHRRGRRDVADGREMSGGISWGGCRPARARFRALTRRVTGSRPRSAPCRLRRMKTLRATMNRYVVSALAGWSVLMYLVQTFKGTNVGGLACETDPTCGEVGWVPWAFWLGGVAIILLIGSVVAYATRTRL